MTSASLIIEQARKIVGVDHAIELDDDRVAGHRHLLGDVAATTSQPAAVLMPESVEQIQSIVKLAGTAGFSITTVPNAAGNGAGLNGGNKPAVILDLDRMNKVIEFNPESGYALVEPGVSFDQLRSHIRDSGSAYWVDCDANGANSVSGSITERAFGYTPYGDHLLMQCGMEVVTGKGEVLRTGMGALPGSDTWQLFKYNYGPYLDGLFSRSDFAVVTKMGLWLMPAPPTYFPFMVELTDSTALEQAVEVLRPLKIGMVVPNTVILSHHSADTDLLHAAGETPTRDREQSEWTLYGALYGLAENVQITWDTIAGTLGSIPNATVSTLMDPPQHPAWLLRTRLMRGESIFSKIAVESDRKLWFAASAPIEGKAAMAMQRIVQESFSQRNISYTYEYALTWRTLLMRVSIAYTSDDVAAHRDAALGVIGELTAAGYPISHDSRGLTAAVSAAHTGDALQQLYTSLGDALDPQSVLRDGWSV
jgi:4-cresol dehydrogenase (hydroxylating)